MYRAVADAIVDTEPEDPGAVGRRHPRPLAAPVRTRPTELPLAVSLPVHLILGCGLFAIGTVVGSFLNVCIYRIPWQKSVIWPASRCPKCFHSIAARDNVPIVSWLALRGACRHCGLPISARYPLVEAARRPPVRRGLRDRRRLRASHLLGRDAGLPRGRPLLSPDPARPAGRRDVHRLRPDTIPDEITVTGMVLGVALGALFPEVRPDPSTAVDARGGLLGGGRRAPRRRGLTWSVRFLGTLAFRREAMGFGDVTLMAMIGAFLGWQAAVLTFFLAPFFGLAHALWQAR